MTAAPKMRDLAQRLLAYEVEAGNGAEPTGSPTLRVYERLRLCLGEFVGGAGFQSLASRALTLAKLEAPSLNSARVAADGTLGSLGDTETQIDVDRDWADEDGTILIAYLIGLLRMFLGEALTLSLLRNAWPDEAIDDHNSSQGRKT